MIHGCLHFIEVIQFLFIKMLYLGQLSRFNFFVSQINCADFYVKSTQQQNTIIFNGMLYSNSRHQH